MPTTFDEILLDVRYSSDATGGPEFQSAVVQFDQGGANALRNANLEDFKGRYEIDFSQVETARRKALRTFAILRDGQTRGFRFLAPDEYLLQGDDGLGEPVGYLNPATGEVEYLAETDGNLTTFYLIRHFSDQANFYTRRIVKPSPFDNLEICIWIGESQLDKFQIPAYGAAPPPYNVIAETYNATLGGIDFTFNFHQGIITFDSAPTAGRRITVLGVYHVPVVFGDDWHNFKVDDGGLSQFRVRLNELLPVELGIT